MNTKVSKGAYSYILTIFLGQEIKTTSTYVATVNSNINKNCNLKLNLRMITHVLKAAVKSNCKY